ncbi:MAG: PAS domain S-box protein [Fimbriimonas sp.]
MKDNVSVREREIVHLAPRGLTDKEIANELGIAAGTIRTYWERVRTKTSAKSRSEVVAQILGEELNAITKEAIQAKEDLALLLEEAQNYAVFRLAPDGTILDWNSGVLRVLGFGREDFIGAHFSIVFTPDDVAAGEPERELQEASVVGRCLERHYHMKKDGTKVWIDGTLVAHRDEAGRVRRFSKIMRDDTQRKSLEEEVQRLRARTYQAGRIDHSGDGSASD